MYKQKNTEININVDETVRYLQLNGNPSAIAIEKFKLNRVELSLKIEFLM